MCRDHGGTAITVRTLLFPNTLPTWTAESWQVRKQDDQMSAQMLQVCHGCHVDLCMHCNRSASLNYVLLSPDSLELEGREEVGATLSFGNFNRDIISSFTKKTGGQSHTLRRGRFITGMSPPLICSSDHIKWYKCDNANVTVNSSRVPEVRAESEW